MAISNDESILNILKVWYKDDVESLLVRESSALKEIPFTRVEGKVLNFAALYSRGGAVSCDWDVAKESAAKNVRNAEFSVKPGQLFSCYSYNTKEVQASLSKRGAYMKVASEKLFAATVSFRQTLAASLFGTGYGEIGLMHEATAFTANTATEIKLNEDESIKIDVGSKLVIKSGISDVLAKTELLVTEIDDTKATVIPTTDYTATIGDVICLKGCVSDSGEALGPLGLASWLPYKNGRSGTEWENYVNTTFCGVNRKVAPSRLCGQFYMPEAEEKKVETLQKTLRKVRRAGGNPDLIIMNDADFYALTQELAAMNTYYSQPTKSKRAANVGYEGFSVSFATNFVENIYDDAFCPKGVFYVLDKKTWDYYVYTMSDSITNDGVAVNQPGKQDPEALGDKFDAKGEYKVLIDDMINVQPGAGGQDGPSVLASLLFYGSLACSNPSVNGVGLFYNADGYSGVLGY